MTLVSNPFADPLFLPLAARVGGVLILVLAVLVGIAWRSGTPLRDDVLIKRWMSWLGIAVVLVLGLLSGPLPFAVLVMAMIAQGLREFATLVGLPKLYRRVALALGCTIPFIAMMSSELFHLAVPLFLVGATIQPLRAFPDNPNAVRDLAFALLGWGYVAWFLSHLVLIYTTVPGGDGLLVAIVASVALSDVGAYTFGRSFGKAKLAPAISPNKTIAGALGNIAGAYVAFGLMSFALPPALPKTVVVILPLIIGAASLWGDLFESVLKREFGVKDAGDWLPGFGGLLDRMDSLILVAPITLYSVELLS
ncbi:phosphatidate cytidylyltransferase [Tropicimonas marinistellae]|uniref:phosphatidate cytidylyltransferase n=1 Tax=Tropicimonas marinistellae TaxID=1739787 RepID=UPI00082E6034|nr:phosphatidate cytidylyltransferase [Tropicimonas marinistellae]